MKLKSKAKALMMMLALSTSTTGCSNYRDTFQKEVNDIMDESVFYQDSYLDETNEEYYGDFYELYLTTFIKYMSKDQYNIFKNLVNEVPYIDRYDYDEKLLYLDNILCKNCDTKGYGFYHAFNDYLLFEGLTPAYDLRDDTFIHIHTLKSLIEDDDSFFKALFSKKISKIINLICEKTEIDDPELVEQMIIDFDRYIIAKNNRDLEEQEMYSNNIQNVMNQIVRSKINNDPSFAKTFYAKMLKESNYYGKKELTIIHPLLVGKPYIILDSEEKGFVFFEFETEYFDSDIIELKDLELICIDAKLKEEFEKKENSEIMSLLSFILSPNCNLTNKTNFEEVRKVLYRDLSSYFESEVDFNDFLFRFVYLNEYAQEKYIDIFKNKIIEDGIDLMDFERFQAFVNLYREHTYFHYISLLNGYVDQKEYSKKRPEELGDDISVIKESFLLSENIDYEKEFEEIEEILIRNDLGFEYALNDQIKFSWWNNSIECQYDSLTEVYSSVVDVQTMVSDRNVQTYFEIPNGFEDGHLVEVFKNIAGDVVVRQIQGSKINITDPVTSEEKSVIVVSLIDEEQKFPEEIRFATSIQSFQNHYNFEKSMIKNISRGRK